MTIKHQHDLRLQARRRQTARHKWAALASVLILFIGIFAIHGPAWSFESTLPSSAVDADDNPPLITSLPGGAEDPCLPLLRTAGNDGPVSATDRDRRTAGQAAALGLVFGVRFALGPKEVTGSRKGGSSGRFEIWQPSHGGGSHALAVADYRRCKNEHALKDLSDWRWRR